MLADICKARNILGGFVLPGFATLSSAVCSFKALIK